VIAIEGLSATVSGDVPLMIVGSGHRHRPAVFAGGAEIVDVLRELVKRVSSRQGATHRKLERSVVQIREGDRDLGFVVRPIGERDRIANRALRGDLGDTQHRQDDRKSKGTHGSALYEEGFLRRWAELPGA